MIIMKGDRRRQFIWNLLRFLLCFPLRVILGIKAKKYKLEKKKPYVILSNHVAQIDPIYVAMSFKRHINYIAYAGVCYGKYKKVLNRYFAPIPKTKGKTDMMTIRESLKVMKKNGVLGLFPSGDCTFSGVESYIDPSIVKFLRMMKAEILLYRLDGVYGKSPRWAHKRTKGKMYGEVKRVITVDEMNAMSDEELYNVVVNTIGGNSLDYIGDNLYKGKYCAEYLERALYVCPDCKEIGTLISHKDTFSCASCGYKAVYKPNLHFELVKGKNLMETVNDWYNYCIESLKEKDQEKEFDTDEVIFKDQFEYLKTDQLVKDEKGYTVKQEIICENGYVRLYKNRFVLENSDGKEVAMLPLKHLKLIFHGKKNLVIYNEELTYTVHGFDRFCGMKYIHLVDNVLKNKIN